MSPRRSRLVLPHDQYKKLCILVHQRDNWKCRVPYCGARQGLHSHHIIYRSDHGDDAEWNLITVCNRCHDAIHNRYLVVMPLVEGEAINATEGVKWMFLAGWHSRPTQSRVS